jgi:hypothetical protein
MPQTRDWEHNRDMWIRVLERQTGDGLDVWNRRIAEERFRDEDQLEGWLTRRGVSGYAKQLLVMERFDYPDFLRVTADELIDGQYAGCPHLREVYDALVKAAVDVGDVIVQPRKTYVSLVSPRRTFARIQRASKGSVNLGLRLDGKRATGRLQPSSIHETMRLQITLARVADVDSEVRRWLKRAYAENA